MLADSIWRSTYGPLSKKLRVQSQSDHKEMPQRLKDMPCTGYMSSLSMQTPAEMHKPTETHTQTDTHTSTRIHHELFACATIACAGQKTPPARYRLLDRDGLAAVGDYISPGDVYINLQRPTNTCVTSDVHMPGAHRIWGRNWAACVRPLLPMQKRMAISRSTHTLPTPRPLAPPALQSSLGHGHMAAHKAWACGQRCMAGISNMHSPGQ